MQRVYHVAETVLARSKIGALAELVGTTSQGDDYFATWYTTGSVAAERSGMRGALGLCDALDHLRAHMLGKSWGIRRLAAFYPPQRGKSTHVTELFPAAIYGVLPTARGIIAGYADDFMKRTPAAVKHVMSTPGYRQLYPYVNLGDVEAVEGDRAKDNAHRVEVIWQPGGRGAWRKSGGSLTTRSLRGQVIGEPMDFGALDDMYPNWQSALSKAENKVRFDFYTGVYKQRQQSRRTVMVLGFTPWTSTDLAAFILDQWEKEGEPYLVLRYPTLQRHDKPKEIERFRKSLPQQQALAKFLGVPEDRLIEYVEEHGLRPYDRRPIGMALLPSHRPDADQEFFEQKKRSANAAQWEVQDQLDTEGAATGLFPAERWRWYDPARKNTFKRIVISGDPNKRETAGGSFYSLGVWGLDPAVAAKVDGRTIEPLFPWYIHALDEARGRWNYSDGIDQIFRLVDRWPEARDVVLEHKANGEAAAGDVAFVGGLLRRGVRLWVYEPSGKLVRVTLRNGKIVHEEKADKLQGGSKDLRWAPMEAPFREGYFLLPSCAGGRIRCDFLRDQEDLDLDPEERMGLISEFAQASPDNCNDRVDQLAQLVAFAQTLSTQSDWAPLRAFA